MENSFTPCITIEAHNLHLALKIVEVPQNLPYLAVAIVSSRDYMYVRCGCLCVQQCITRNNPRRSTRARRARWRPKCARTRWRRPHHVCNCNGRIKREALVEIYFPLSSRKGKKFSRASYSTPFVLLCYDTKQQYYFVHFDGFINYKLTFNYKNFIYFP